MMENEEKEDLLIEFTESEEESCDKEEIDCDVEEKILDFVRQEKPPFQSKKKTLIFTTCLLMFIASSTLVIVLPIYVKYSSLENISTYSKLFTISLANAILFGIVHVFGVILKCECQWSPNHNLSFSEILKVSFFLSAGSISIFWLIDGNYVKCHLEDPLKGCAIVFSLLFYYVFSRKSKFHSLSLPCIMKLSFMNEIIFISNFNIKFFFSFIILLVNLSN